MFFNLKTINMFLIIRINQNYPNKNNIQRYIFEINISFIYKNFVCEFNFVKKLLKNIQFNEKKWV